MEILKDLHEKIVKFIEDHPVEVEWDYNDSLDKSQIVKILEDGLFDFENELWEMNIDYICEQENYLIDRVKEEFEDELQEYELDDDYLYDNYREFISVDMNVEQLIGRGKITVLLYLYSNYDCTNSFDTMKSSEYLQQVYKRVKNGVKKDDFMWEHMNGAYGGSLFCFAFKIGLMDLIKFKQEFKNAKRIKIPKGTQFGYFSSFQGAGSIFEKTTYKNFYLNVAETGGDYHPDYDHVGIVADVEQSYNMTDVYGDSDFIYEQNIQLEKKMETV